MTQDLTFHQDKDYKSFLDKLKIQIKSAQFRAAMAVNQEAIKHYWQIGIEIIENNSKNPGGVALLKLYHMICGTHSLKHVGILRLIFAE